jgi:site-specific recombinase XerC
MARTPKLSHRILQKHTGDFLASLASPETRGTYGRALREFLRWQQEEARTFSGTGDVHRYRKYLEKKKKLSSASVATYLTALRRLCDHLVCSAVLPSNPASGVSCTQSTRAHTHDMLSAQEMETLFSAIDRGDERGSRDLALMRLMAVCGLTPVELVRADIGDVSLTGRRATLAVQRKGRRKKDTVIDLPTDVRTAIREYLAFRSRAKKSEPLFESSGNRTRGARMTPRGLRSRISHYLTKAGLASTARRTLSPVSLRHTAVAQSVLGGATIEEVREKFHIGTDTTAKLYIKTA